MKLSTALLLVSLVANTVLLAWVVRRPTAAMVVPVKDVVTPATTDPEIIVPTTPADAALPSALAGPHEPWWSQHASDDLHELARRLTAAGFPRAVVRAVVVAELNRRTREQREELLGGEPQNYWQSRRRPVDTAAGPEIGRRMNEIQNERQATLRELLGVDYMIEDEALMASLRRRYGVADPAKLAQLQLILQDYQEVGSELSGGGPTPADRESREETRDLLQREQMADIAALLTPEEFAAYDLRASNTATSLRSMLRDFRPTEEEYRALFAAARNGGDPDPRGFDFKQLLAQVRESMPPERYADLQQALTPGAQRLNRLASRLDLPLSALAPVAAVQQELRGRAIRVQRDDSLSAAQRDTQLAAIAAEATQKVTAAIGERGFAVYRDYDGGWIGELTAPSATPQP